MNILVRALDSSGDWTFGQGIQNYKSNQKAVQQDIQTRLKSFLGDCFFDLSAGINWFQFLGSKDQLSLNLAVSAVILNTTGVQALNQLYLTLTSARQITISYNVTTVYSTVVLGQASISL